MKGKRSKHTPAQLLLGQHLAELGFVDILYEYKICPDRRWRADLSAFGPGRSGDASTLFLFECDGGHRWHRSWHVSKKMKARAERLGQVAHSPIENDYERQNYCQVKGFKILRFTNDQVLKGQALAWLKEHFA